MSRENVELIRREWERWNAGEREIDPEAVHPDLVVHSAMTNSTYSGHEGLRRWMAEIDDQFEDWRLLIDQFRDAPDGRFSRLGRCTPVAAPVEWTSTNRWPGFTGLSE